MTERPPDQPANFEELLWYIRRYEDGIFVREQIDGKWDSVALSALSPKRWAYYLDQWLTDGHIPVRVKEDSEMAETLEKP